MKTIIISFLLTISCISTFCFKKKGKLDAAEEVEKAHARAGELEKLVEKLKNDFDLKNSEKQLLEYRMKTAEKKASELTTKLESVSPSSL